VDEYMSEHEQWQLLKRWLRANGPWIVGGVLVGVAALSGWRWWQAHLEQRALDASQRYETIVETLRRGDRARAFTLIEDLRSEHPSSPYVDQADLLAARAHVEANELDKAAERLRDVMKRTDDRQLALVARMRLARVQLAQDKPDDALATLNAVNPGAFAARYHEVRGDIYVAKGDREAALKEYRAARDAATDAVVDTELLDLKINDLLAEGANASAPPATAAN